MDTRTETWNNGNQCHREAEKIIALYKLLTELGIKGKMWLVIKDLYTDVNARVHCSGSFSRSFAVSWGRGQGRILAPFMYKVYINSLLIKLYDYRYLLMVLNNYPPPFQMISLSLHCNHLFYKRS